MKLLLPAMAMLAFPMSSAAVEPAVQTEVHGDWVVQCVEREGIPPCEIAQGANVTETGEQVMRVSFAYRGSGDRYATQIRLPLGVRLTPEPQLRLDGGADLEGYAFTRCDSGGCYIERLLGPAEIDRFRKAGAAVLAVMGGDGQPIALPLSFAGFGEALDASASRNSDWAKATGL